MALPAASPAPVLTVIPGGRRRITVDLDQVEEGWIEVQAVALDAMQLAGVAVAAARRIQVAIARGHVSFAGQLAHELEAAVPLHGNRARRAHRGAQEALDDLHPRDAA